MIYLTAWWWFPYGQSVVADAGNSNVWFPIISAVAVILAAVIAYFGARLRNSGRIVNSDSTDLWEEGKAIRLELREEVRRLTGENIELKERMEACERDHGGLKRRVETLEAENAILKQRLSIMEGNK